MGGEGRVSRLAFPAAAAVFGPGISPRISRQGRICPVPGRRARCYARHRTGNEGRMYDLVIDNARIIDGLGNPAFIGGLAVKDGRIAAIADAPGPARERLDAGGLVLAPGIIDLHTHFDAQLTWDPFARPSPALGVTTVVIGNCGFTIAPCRPEDRDRTLRNLTHVEGMSLAALRAGVDWGFETYPQYLDMLATKGMVPNRGPRPHLAQPDPCRGHGARGLARRRRLGL